MYLGHLKDGSKVAIKRMKAGGERGVKNDFMTEVISKFPKMSSYCHVTF